MSGISDAKSSYCRQQEVYVSHPFKRFLWNVTDIALLRLYGRNHSKHETHVAPLHINCTGLSTFLRYFETS